MREILRKKRDGGVLSAEEIGRWIAGVTDGSVPDYQSAALLMALTLRGMNGDETLALTRAMLESGPILSWGTLGRTTVDKHSTGGVGDKTSIALAPWVAACGAAVPMLAGRGLGHTGGTLDKLEAIPGFRTRLTIEEIRSQLERVGVVIAGASDRIAPADAVLYALRDVTATVESRPLIVASILSKKLAAGASALAIDVKCGRGAFMQSREEARALGLDLLAVTHALGGRAGCILTAMDQPIGLAIGNASEASEAFALLRGGGPPDLAELTRRLGVAMLLLARVARDRHEAEARLDRALESGSALQRAEAMIQAQGGDPRAVVDPARLPRAPVETPARATRGAYVGSIDARALGELLVRMGGGRRQKEDAIDPSVGIRLLHKVGDRVEAGQDLALVEAGREAPEWAAVVERAYTLVDGPPPQPQLILEDLGR